MSIELVKSIIEERRNSKKIVLETFIIGDSGTGKTCIMDRFSVNYYLKK
jgi:GTPase SAR1 family protein